MATTMGLPSTLSISTPMTPVDSSGRISTGLRLSRVRGSLMVLARNCVRYPARKPARMPPRKPAPMAEEIMPPTMPGARPGRSAMENEM